MSEFKPQRVICKKKKKKQACRLTTYYLLLQDFFFRTEKNKYCQTHTFRIFNS
jgi:hypothetical protein